MNFNFLYIITPGQPSKIIFYLIYFNSKSTAELKQRNENPFIVVPKRQPLGRRGREFGQRIKRKIESEAKPVLKTKPTILELKDEIEDKIENQSKNRLKRQVSQIN